MKRLLEMIVPHTLDHGLASGRYRYDEDGELEKRARVCAASLRKSCFPYKSLDSV